MVHASKTFVNLPYRKVQSFVNFFISQRLGACCVRCRLFWGVLLEYFFKLFCRSPQGITKSCYVRIGMQSNCEIRQNKRGHIISYNHG